MFHRSGTTLFVRDLALELQKQGHDPAVYTWGIGPASKDLLSAGIPVETSLKRIPIRPDIIHCHHNHIAAVALRYFADTPAIYICHDHMAIFDEPLVHCNIKTYFAVSKVCYDRIRTRGIDDENISLLKNFVDTQRFLIRPDLPKSPRRALLFSNYAHDTTQLPAVMEACRITGLELDVVGLGVGRPIERPEEILGKYDIVFAKAKAAMEAMAVGTAVILCDFSGVGPLVTSNNFTNLQPLNFGFQALSRPLRPEFLVDEIKRYNSDDAGNVRDLLRKNHRLDDVVNLLVAVYRRTIESYQPIEYRQHSTKTDLKNSCLAMLIKIRFLLPYKSTLNKIPGYKVARAFYWRLLRIEQFKKNLPARPATSSSPGEGEKGTFLSK